MGLKLRTRKRALSDSSRCWSFAWSIWSVTWLCWRSQNTALNTGGKGATLLEEADWKSPRPGKIENNCLVVDLKGRDLGSRMVFWTNLNNYGLDRGNTNFQARVVHVALSSLGLGISGVPISALSQIYSVLGAMFWSEIAPSPLHLSASDATRTLQNGHEIDQKMMINQDWLVVWSIFYFPIFWEWSLID